MAIHSRTIAWKIPWTEEPGRLQSAAAAAAKSLQSCPTLCPVQFSCGSTADAVARFLFTNLPKENTSPALYQSLTDAGPLPGGQSHAGFGEGFPDI